MELHEIRETKILITDPHGPFESGSRSTKTLNRHLKAGWVLLNTCTQASGDGDEFFSFVIGWPKELPAAAPEPEPQRQSRKTEGDEKIPF
jgi:hypothetical protein